MLFGNPPADDVMASTWRSMGDLLKTPAHSLLTL
jgi:hypothetical protein